MCGHFDVVKLLLEHKANINHFDKFGFSALICAAQEGHIEIVELLVEQNANIEQGHKFGNTPLLEAVRCGHGNLVRKILELGANINHLDINGFSALCWALEKHFLDIAELLINLGADTIVCSNNGKLLPESRQELFRVLEKINFLNLAQYVSPFSSGIEAVSSVVEQF